MKDNKKKKAVTQNSNQSLKPTNDIKKKNNILIQFFSPKSMLLGLGGILLLFVVLKNNTGYSWVWNGLLKGNWSVVKKYPNASLDDKYFMKIDVFGYYKHIRDNTPDSALILIPSSDEFNNGARMDKMVATYFLYPRRVIIASDKGRNPLWNKATHIFIINPKDFDYVDYPVENKMLNMIFPLKTDKP